MCYNTFVRIHTRNPLIRTYLKKGEMKVPFFRWTLLSLIRIIGYVIMVIASFSNPALFAFLIGYLLVKMSRFPREYSDVKHLEKAFDEIGERLDTLEERVNEK